MGIFIHSFIHSGGDKKSHTLRNISFNLYSHGHLFKEFPIFTVNTHCIAVVHVDKIIKLYDVNFLNLCLVYVYDEPYNYRPRKLMEHGIILNN